MCVGTCGSAFAVIDTLRYSAQFRRAGARLYTQDHFHPSAGCAPLQIRQRRKASGKCEELLFNEKSVVSKRSASREQVPRP